MVQKDRSRLVGNRGGKGANQVSGKAKGPGGLPSKTGNPLVVEELMCLRGRKVNDN